MTHDIAPPKTTPRMQAKAERRQALIGATIDCIATYGLSGTTMARVAEFAGSSIGLANFHFASKEALLEAVLRYLTDDERDIWHKPGKESPLTLPERLMALVDARFHPRCCDRRRMAVWFAFWGDASAREIYRRVVADFDDERLEATEEIIEGLTHDGLSSLHDPYQTALGLEAFYDGLWLNFLLYPDDFTRQICRQRAVEHLQALFPQHFGSQSLVPRRTAARPTISKA